jgi:hypothetical protein
MTEKEVKAYLLENGYAEHIVALGYKGLLRRYEEFVAAVEKGYKFHLEDYRNDLDMRAILSLYEKRDPALDSLDDRFRKMLKPAKGRIWESGEGEPFWDFQVPRNASGALLKDLQSENLV